MQGQIKTCARSSLQAFHLIFTLQVRKLKHREVKKLTYHTVHKRRHKVLNQGLFIIKEVLLITMWQWHLSISLQCANRYHQSPTGIHGMQWTPKILVHGPLLIHFSRKKPCFSLNTSVFLLVNKQKATRSFSAEFQVTRKKNLNYQN